jgi:hypothetical protein
VAGWALFTKPRTRGYIALLRSQLLTALDEAATKLRGKVGESFATVYQFTAEVSCSSVSVKTTWIFSRAASKM